MKLPKVFLFVAIFGCISAYIMYLQNTENSPDFLVHPLSEIEMLFPQKDQKNEQVSKVAGSWHLYHSLMVINNICDAITVSDPQAYESSFSASRLYCFTMGYFPRGIAQSPKSVLPPEAITTEDLITQLKLAKAKLKAIENLDDRVHFEHPYFKKLNKGQTKRFLKIHTEHHLKIIRDILEI